MRRIHNPYPDDIDEGSEVVWNKGHVQGHVVVSRAGVRIQSCGCREAELGPGRGSPAVCSSSAEGGCAASLRSLTEVATCSSKGVALSWPKDAVQQVFSCSIVSCSFRELSIRAAWGNKSREQESSMKLGQEHTCLAAPAWEAEASVLVAEGRGECKEKQAGGKVAGGPECQGQSDSPSHPQHPSCYQIRARRLPPMVSEICLRSSGSAPDRECTLSLAHLDPCSS